MGNGLRTTCQNISIFNFQFSISYNQAIGQLSNLPSLIGIFTKDEAGLR